ncbi:uncharacterized protein DNG_08771 [Cephalotrichum gorgonifer]|uniref:Rhodopsin domain-containing protein n=1 Tax=Cephalotrichum gorgonifer TaxID=2041049 RepID=A0AAE8N4S3_9PEZI|nr:uncharacterized protein DNG_08771 [Cephalotrichum gorgonifer]
MSLPESTGIMEDPLYPDEFIGQSVVPCAVVSTGLAAMCVGLRFYARGAILRRLGLEDWFILGSLIFAVGSMSGTIAMVEFGLGRHKIHLSQQQVTGYLQANLYTSVLYVASLFFTKLSILNLYLRILTHEHIQTATKGLLAVVVVSHIYIISNLLASCVPLRAFWHIELRKTSYCHGKEIYWSNYVLHIATDFLIFFLPLPVISRLKIPRRQKIPLFAVFLAAFTVCAISVLRMVIFLDSNRDRGAADFTFTTISMANWSMIEICASIICACLPTLKPLLARVAPASFRSMASSPASGRREVSGYERPRTIGTGPRRDPSGAVMTDAEGGGEWVGGSCGEGVAERARERKMSFASCSDAMSEKRARVREEEFAGSAWSREDEEGGEKRLESSPLETPGDGR